MVASRRRPAAPRRPGAQSGRHRQGLRDPRRDFIFGDIANARAGLLNARDPQSKIEANGKLDSAFGRLLALSENYPELKSNQNFLALQDQLEGSENRIAVERKRYNDTLQDYNTFIRQFPNSIWAGIAGFQPNNAYFQASEGSKVVPTVKF